MVIPVVFCVGYRKVPSLCYRSCSTYVRRMRYLSELKEDDVACRQAYSSGSFVLFHNLSPFLQQKGKMFSALKINAPEMKRILQKFSQSERQMEDSMLVGCSEECTPYFALDLGSLERAALESELGGSFADLRKAFVRLEEEDTTLIFLMSPVVITLVSDGSRCLLVRQASFPRGMYSALSGFCDVGETLEETVRREVAEEVGLEVESLWYSASQHWPFPNSTLMIGCHAMVCSQQSQISINQQELEAAKWFSLEEVEQALGRGPIPSQDKDDGLSFWVPPKQAIAHKLLQEWVKKQSIRAA
ncbi:NAD(P)H pyrophosphatase NUDT13, mitochondrial isoform X2 [Sphaerodactylus townsendi]|uniref:NAD(P)H pyrophosphatase NUDT13, mitochondrial isoform X2 n=1 Tax=Sphaerodactylus townsendi TaxID=933632 RepID=UPI0020262DA5|nr:NAD(P)H pyrophosphatase NUDT13, mitochondrial isoform X2 [Sphaerodactylus townsendi]